MFLTTNGIYQTRTRSEWNAMLGNASILLVFYMQTPELTRNSATCCGPTLFWLLDRVFWPHLEVTISCFDKHLIYWTLTRSKWNAMLGNTSRLLLFHMQTPELTGNSATCCGPTLFWLLDAVFLAVSGGDYFVSSTTNGIY